MCTLDFRPRSLSVCFNSSRMRLPATGFKRALVAAFGAKPGTPFPRGPFPVVAQSVSRTKTPSSSNPHREVHDVRNKHAPSPSLHDRELFAPYPSWTPHPPAVWASRPFAHMGAYTAFVIAVVWPQRGPSRPTQPSRSGGEDRP